MTLLLFCLDLTRSFDESQHQRTKEEKILLINIRHTLKTNFFYSNQYKDIRLLLELVLMYMSCVLNIREPLNLPGRGLYSLNNDTSLDNFYFTVEVPRFPEDLRKRIIPSYCTTICVKLLLALQMHSSISLTNFYGIRPELCRIAFDFLINVDAGLHNVKRVAILTNLFVGWQYNLKLTDKDNNIWRLCHLFFRSIMHSCNFHKYPVKEWKIYFQYALLFRLEMAHRYCEFNFQYWNRMFLDTVNPYDDNELCKFASIFHNLMVHDYDEKKPKNKNMNYRISSEYYPRVMAAINFRRVKRRDFPNDVVNTWFERRNRIIVDL